MAEDATPLIEALLEVIDAGLTPRPKPDVASHSPNVEYIAKR